MKDTRRNTRIIYAAGPGHILRTYQFWAAGVDDPHEVAVTYSAQFFDVCRELECEARIISYNPNRGFLREGRFVLEHRPMFPSNARGVVWHLAQVLWGIRFIISALRFRASVAVVSSGSHGFVFAILPLLGIRVIPTLHCVLWRKHRIVNGTWRFINRLNARLFLRSTAIMSISNDVTSQLNALIGSASKTVIPFLPFYRRAVFGGIPICVYARPFRVLYAGRIIRSKGVFDLLEIAVRLKDAGRTTVEFDLCGDGEDLGTLLNAADDAGLSSSFRCHGHCDKERMREFYGRSQVVIAPTKTDFIEGFNKVVAEGILAGRPVITSDTCPALDYVRDAVVEVPSDDISALELAIVKLHDDRELFEQKATACRKLQEQFYDSTGNWAAALKRAVSVVVSANANGR